MKTDLEIFVVVIPKEGLVGWAREVMSPITPPHSPRVSRPEKPTPFRWTNMYNLF